MKSSKYHTNWLIILLALIVLISGSASALTEDFTAFAAKKELSACACDFRTEKLTVQNTGDITSNFMVLTSGEAAKWVETAPQSFILEPGEIKTVEQLIKIPCKKTGEHKLNTTIKTLFDMEKSLEQTLKVQNCQNIQIIPKFSGVQTECPCTPVQYSFEVLNTGMHTEMYDLSVEPFSKAITLSTDFLILEPGEKQTVDVFINLECGQYGEKVFTFNALAEGTGMLGQTDFILDIQKCYDYDLIVGSEYGICQGIPNAIPFKIDNKAGIANEYIINVHEAEWAFPENTSIAAWGGETAESNIILTPPVEAEGQYTITLETISVRGEEQRLSEIVLFTEKCHDYALIQSENAFEAIQCKEKDHIFTLTNIGSRETTYIIEPEGFGWLTTTTEPIVLQPGESVDLIINGKTPCDVEPGKYAENIYITMAEVNQTYLEEKIFTIHTKEEAFLPEIEFDNLKIGFKGGETQARITNTGFEEATYDLGLTASDWITLDTTRVRLAPGENATFTIQANPTEEAIAGSYAAELLARVAGENVEYSTGFMVDLRQETGTPLWIILTAAGGALALLIIIMVIIILLGKKKKPKDKEESEEEAKKSKNPITIDRREYLKKKKEEKSVKVWPVILIIAIAILVAGGLYYASTLGLLEGLGTGQNKTAADTGQQDTQAETPEEQDETAQQDIVLTEEDTDEALITIDRSGIPGDGNTIEATEDMEEIDLEMSINNPTDRKATFEVSTPADSWTQFETSRVTVLPESTKKISLKIIPDMDTLEENDYSVNMDVSLEGKKIDYKETLELIITKDKKVMKSILMYWPWVVAGIVALLAILSIIGFASRKQEESKEEKKDKTKDKKADSKEKKKQKAGKRKAWPLILTGIVVLLIVLALGFWAYNTFIPAEDSGEGDSDEGTDIDVNEDMDEEPEEEKITEDDVEDSLILIDRSGVPGEGNELEFEAEEYTLPLSVNNPTDRKARFQVNTDNESWVSFNKYNIIVEPESIKTVDMTITPDMEALKESNYMIKINTLLEGKKIDYEEELSFVIKEKKDFSIPLWAYALAGIIILGMIITTLEIMKRKEKKQKKTAKSMKRKTTKKKDKDITSINKELSALRKKTVLKVKK